MLGISRSGGGLLSGGFGRQFSSQALSFLAQTVLFAHRLVARHAAFDRFGEALLAFGQFAGAAGQVGHAVAAA